VSMGQELDETMKAKVTNDAVAYIKGIATNNGRNADIAAKMVSDAISITAEEALSADVIDILATDIDSLIGQIQGREFVTAKGTFVLDLAGATVEDFPMGFRREFLFYLSNPNVAYILMMLGIMGLYFELANPGAIFPGVIGGICLILAFYAFQTLPINYAGFALIILSVILFIIEIKVASHGLLAIGGVIALLLGSLMLFKSSAPYFRVALGVILPTVIGVSLFFIGTVYLALRAFRSKPQTGAEGIIGEEGVAKSPITGDGGKVFVHGEWWDATSDEPIEAGSRVVIVESKSLTIKVKRKEP